MAGRKQFVAGEILQSAEVNSFLMDQSVMVFDDSAARGSAIPSPTEGMVTYRKDDTAVEFFDGSDFRRVGGLIAVKSAIRTTATSASVSAGGNFAVGGLSITHEVADENNRLIISAYFGAAANSDGNGRCGIAVNEFTSGGTPENVLIGIGTGVGSRTAVGAGGLISPTNSSENVTMPSVTFVHTPGAGEKTYTVRAINIRDNTRTLFVNRSESDTDNKTRSRAASALVIQEVAV